MGGPPFHLEFERVPRTGTCRVRVSGDFDFGAVPTLDTALAAVVGDIDLDCSDVEFVDAAALGAMVRAHKVCLARGDRFTIVDPAPCVLRLLALTDLDRFLCVRLERDRG